MKLLLASMTVRLAAAITAAVVLTCAGGAWIYSSHHFEALLATARAGALGQGELIRVALEHQMMENDRSLIARMIQSFGAQPGVERVVLLDRHGVLRYSSRPNEPAGDLQIGSPTCQACHQLPPDQRGSSRVIEDRGGTLLRTVVPIHNQPRCHRCHDPGHKINGILILDHDAGEIRANMNQDLRWMVLITGLLTLLMVGAIALVIRYFLLRRLQRLETTARMVAAGDLDRRVPTDGSDTLAWLGREFNTMADSVTGLIGEVRNQRERLENVINSIDDGIVVLDPQRKVIAANDAFLKRAGQSRDQVLGCCCRDGAAGACSIEDCPSLTCLASGKRQVRICERRNPDGSVAWEEIHASPLLDPAGNLMHVVEVWRDISERRTAEAHLAESHRLASLGYLASGFSHELNTPLATVLTCVEGLLREAGQNPDAPADLDRIRENASIAREQILRCRAITQHFLRMSRGQSSAGGIVPLQSAVEAVRRLIEPTARAHSVTVDVSPIPDSVHLRADEAELQHTIVNLLLNAIQACPRGGRVSLSVDPAAAPGGTVRIRVADNGCGIAPEFLKRIFEPFVGLRSGGTGLGLFLSLNFVRRWGGDITVESTPGQGSTFEISLPAFSPSREQELVP
ncbi:MAG: PAS domain-containing protein [Acidobacteria bacterium]|nr:PAS domain-containing protein [Acidobacteriota bacterium]